MEKGIKYRGRWFTVQEIDENKAFVSTLAPLFAPAVHLRIQPISDEQYYRQTKEIQQKIIAVSRSPA